jgi:O-acetyl-ADP-ribose deacetylase (regulator of RNase III)
MGAGVAKGIKEAFPFAYAADFATARGDRAKLGTCTVAEVMTKDPRNW